MAHDGPTPLSVLSDTLKLNKTTVFNLAESLTVLGYLQRTKNPRGYRLGLRCLELGRHVSDNLPILEISRPALRALCLSTKEMVNLAVPYLREAILVEVLQSPQGVRATAHAGAPSGYHSSACGKALLAHLPEERRNWIYKNLGLKKITEFTITDKRVLEAQLAKIREDGFATEEQENELGASCVAVPIFGPFDEVVAAISITGVVHRMTPDRIAEIVKDLKAHAERISEKLQQG